MNATNASSIDDLISSQVRPRGTLQIRKRRWKGSDFADVREWYAERYQQGALKPGRGVTIKPSELRETIAALTRIADLFAAEAAEREAPAEPTPPERALERRP